jgi:hypothetical protein
MSSRQCFRQDRFIDGHRGYYYLRTKMADVGLPEFEQAQK